MAAKFVNGSLCCYRVREGFTPRTPEALTAMATRHGMPTSVVPEYAGDRAMVGRAIQAHLGPAKAAGWLVQALETGKTKVVYTIARMEKDQERERTDFTHETTVKWSSDGGNGAHLDGWHEVAQQMDETYQQLRGLVHAGDWSKHIVDYIKGTCRGVAFLDSGHMYWVPPQGTAQLQALRGLLDEVGIGLMIGEIEPESHADVQQVAQRGLAEQIQELRSEIDGFDGSQSASVYRTRLGRLRELRATALAYHEAVGINLDALKGLMGSIDAKVRDLLTVRLETVIKKDGTRERVARPSVAAQLAEWQRLVAQGEQAMAQALLDGRVVLDGDAQDVELLVDEAAAAPDSAMLEALDEVDDLDPALAAALLEPGQASDIPMTW